MKIAVVGSGVSGLAATWALNEHSEHEVHLYESDSRPGGHANTVRFQAAKDLKPCNVDSGFIAFNKSTYPNFLNFLQRFKSIQIIPTSMTLSVSKDDGSYEWSGKSIWTVFSQRKRLLDPGMWILLYDILRFNVCSKRILNTDAAGDMSIGDFLAKEQYSDEFRDNYLLPMAAGIWSAPTGIFASTVSARTVIQFLSNHQLLRVAGPTEWLTIEGGSKNYVKEIVNRLPLNQLHLSTAVQSLTTVDTSSSQHPQVLLQTIHGDTEIYDHVILACHSDTALSILKAGGRPSGTGGVTADESRILSMFRWIKNECVMHYDTQLMPRNRRAWSCWNYVPREEENSKDDEESIRSNLIAVTFCMNELQRLPYSDHGPVLITLNPAHSPSTDTILDRWNYDHPLVDSTAEIAQGLMKTIQNTRSISYAGAYLKYGFHEDGFTSGIEAAETAVSGSGSPIDLPFDLVRNVDELLANRSLEDDFLVKVFDFLEHSGIRRVVGGVLGFALILISTVLGKFVDTS